MLIFIIQIFNFTKICMKQSVQQIFLVILTAAIFTLEEFIHTRVP